MARPGRKAASRVDANVTPRSSSKRPSSPKSTPTRQSKRAKTTPKKSYYFEGSDNDDGDDDEDQNDSDSAFGEAGDESEVSAPPSDDDDEDEDDGEESGEEELEPKKRGSAAQKKRSTVLASRPAPKEELWRESARTEYEPGTQVVIKKPKARDAGKTSYSDDTMHPNTMLFLEDLKNNNNREWLKMHDPDYRASFSDWQTFVECMTQKITEVDETIPELPVKDIIFRIYRDVRFSPDPTPYKPYFAAAWSRTGRKGPYAKFYVQIGSGGTSLVGGGLWAPEAQQLAALRRDIDRKPHKIKRVLTDASLRRECLGNVSNDERKAVKAFASTGYNAESALRTKPKGFEKDHPNIELLKLKSFTLGRKLSDEEITGKHFIGRVTAIIQSMLPFVTYLNSVVMPDDDEEDSSDEENDDTGNIGGESGGRESDDPE